VHRGDRTTSAAHQNIHPIMVWEQLIGCAGPAQIVADGDRCAQLLGGVKPARGGPGARTQLCYDRVRQATRVADLLIVNSVAGPDAARRPRASSSGVTMFSPAMRQG
jgi:hypothetical protein